MTLGYSPVFEVKSDSTSDNILKLFYIRLSQQKYICDGFLFCYMQAETSPRSFRLRSSKHIFNFSKKEPTTRSALKTMLFKKHSRKFSDKKFVLESFCCKIVAL